MSARSLVNSIRDYRPYSLNITNKFNSYGNLTAISKYNSFRGKARNSFLHCNVSLFQFVVKGVFWIRETANNLRAYIHIFVCQNSRHQQIQERKEIAEAYTAKYMKSTKGVFEVAQKHGVLCKQIIAHPT